MNILGHYVIIFKENNNRKILFKEYKETFCYMSLKLKKMLPNYILKFVWNITLITIVDLKSCYSFFKESMYNNATLLFINVCEFVHSYTYWPSFT